MQRAWPSGRLVDVVNDLADHGQAVLYFQLWVVTDDGTFWNGHERLDEPLNFRQPWRQVLEDARESALIETACVVARPNLFAPWKGSIMRMSDGDGADDRRCTTR